MYSGDTSARNKKNLAKFLSRVQRREKGKMRVHKLQNIQNVLDYLTTKKKVEAP